MTVQNLIFYTPGCYGTFFEWLFNYLENPTIGLPFKEDGSSHKFVGNFFNPKEKLFEHICSNNKFKFSRIHPGLFEKINKHELCYTDEYNNILQADLTFLKKYFDKILIVTYDLESVLCYENNILEKTYMSESSKMFNDYSYYGYTIDFLCPMLTKDSVQKIKGVLRNEINSTLSPFTYKNLQGWNKTNIDDFEIWELRELLSFYWFTRTDGAVEAWKKIKSSNKDILCISISDLRKNFVKTILQTTEHFKIDNVSAERIREIHHQWLPTQHQINKDFLCHKIFTSLVNKEYFNWSDIKLSIIDEAWIQKKLYDNSIGIKCNNLNIFPTNTDDFLPLLECLNQ
jgi:hypothetical protein